MKNIIACTAGHIDHGKTALVRALTGIDPDRLEEEKRRGITIDLGFAHLPVTSGVRLGFIDVPGHERFVKNMLAGVGGVDLVIFVIAADEGIKPQTREHFEICRLLGVLSGMIALTKADLVDFGALERVRREVEEFVGGSFLETAPIIPVSSTTGEGLERLKGELIRAANGAREKDASGHLRLPVDRVFSMKGFGTVVTGTLISGSVGREQEVEIHPTGRRARVRGIQVYGCPTERAVAGQRTALNLAGVEPSDLARGMMLAEPGAFQATSVFDCSVELLAKPGARVHFHAGAAEIEAEVRWFDDKYARIILHEPSVLLPGDRFVIRRFSPVTTIGGGVVLDNAGLRYRNRAAGAARLKAVAGGAPTDFMGIVARESGAGIGMASLIARTGMPAAEIESIARRPQFVTLHQPEFWMMDAGWFRSAVEDLTEQLRRFHRENPLVAGVAKQSLQLPGARLFVLDALLGAGEQIVVEGDIVRLSGHTVVLHEEEERARETIERAFEQAGLTVPAVAEALLQSSVELKRSRAILQILIRERRLVRVSGELVFHCSAMRRLRELLAEHRAERFGVPKFKEWTGVSRKYAIPLLEYLDREHVTRREGDQRVVL